MTNVHDHCGRPTDFTVAIKLDSKFLRDIFDSIRTNPRFISCFPFIIS